MKISYKYQGFTLIELLITVVVLGILLSVAAPNFRDAMLNSHQTSRVNDLMSSLKFARSEAIKRSSRTAVCARETNDSCGLDWSNGYLVFVDNSATRGALDTDEEIIRVSANNSPATTIVNKARMVNTGEAPIQQPSIQFGPRGTSNWRGTGYFIVCDSRGDESAKGINISLSGDPRRARRYDGVLISSFNNAATCS